MIVIDASAMLEFLLQTPLGARVESRLFREGEEFHSPHLMDVEVTQGLRRLVRSGEVSATRAAEAIEDLGDLALHRHVHLGLLTRAWQLRENVTAYDAMYIALAEALEATMITSDPSINEKGEVAFQGNLRRITDTAGRPDCQTPQQRDTHGRESFSARAGRSRRSLTPTISRAVTSSPSFSLPTQR